MYENGIFLAEVLLVIIVSCRNLKAKLTRKNTLALFCGDLLVMY